MKTVNLAYLREIGKASEGLNYVNPVIKSAEVIKVLCSDGRRRFAVEMTDSNGDKRIYGIVGGHVMITPTMTELRAKNVVRHVLAVENPWFVEAWHVSNILTGYRVRRRISNGVYETRDGFTGNMYVEGSFEEAKRKAEILCDTLNEEVGL